MDGFARQRFSQEISQADNRIRLAQAALYMAQEEYPELDPEEYLNALEVMAMDLAERLPDERYPLKVIRTINQYLFEELGFRGNATDYYAPRNSYLNQVIDRRMGIPITLSLVYLELAQRLDFPMVGVGMPGHFLIRPVVGEMAVFVDAFNQGEVLFEEDCLQRLQEIYGAGATLRPEFLAAVGSRAFLARMLNNLKGVYLHRNQLQQAIAAIERILLLFPQAADERRDRGLVLCQMGQWDAAIADLESYLTMAPAATDAERVGQLIQRIRLGEFS